MANNLGAHLGELFKSSRKKGEEGLPLLSVTLNDGLIVRDQLDRRTETNLESSEHLLVQSGDIAYNMMRVWQGALGRARITGLVSPAYVVLRPTAKIDSLYAEYLFKTPRMIYLFWAYSYGLTKDRLRLYFNDFARIPVEIPDLKEQKEIAKILSTWDKAITTTEQLLANSQQQKKALMQQVLTGKKRLLGKNGVRFGVEWNDHYLTDLAQVIVSPVDKKTIEGELPIELCNYTDVYYNNRITRSLNFMKATAKPSEIEKYTLQVNDVIITKDSETPGDIAVPALVSEDLDGVVCGYHLAIIRPNKECLSGEYLSYLFSMPKTRYYFFTLATGATRFGLSIGGINKAHFRLPPIEEQEKIAAVLSTADQEISTLQQKLDSLKKEKKALMQQLLTGKRRVKFEEVA